MQLPFPGFSLLALYRAGLLPFALSVARRPTRTLAEIMDPQPEASVVIKRLLDQRRVKISWGTR